ncbi:hypothetical protein B0H13DRAFT_2028352, partial [Mycena leptocephala]
MCLRGSWTARRWGGQSSACMIASWLSLFTYRHWLVGSSTQSLSRTGGACVRGRYTQSHEQLRISLPMQPLARENAAGYQPRCVPAQCVLGWRRVCDC